MNVRLLYPDRDADRDAEPPDGARELIADLDLAPVLEAMQPDRDLDRVCPAVLFRPLTDAGQVLWRQQVLTDALAQPDLIPFLFELAGTALQRRRSVWLYGGRSADSRLTKARYEIEALLPSLRELVRFATDRLPSLRSEALRQFCRRLRDDFGDGYLDEVAGVLAQLRFPDGLAARVRVEPTGLLGTPELLPPPPRSWWQRRFVPPGQVRFTLPERDEAGARALGELRNDALAGLALTMDAAGAELAGFFAQLRWETGFYLGCLQLHRRLTASGVAICWPEPAPAGDELVVEGLSGLSLAVRDGAAPVPNGLAGPRVRLAVITGANQGGKTTFLRSVGCAQLLLQAGMFVPAVRYRSSLASTVHSHFRSAEDDAPGAGKLAEELDRMSRIVDRCRPGDLLLLNEPFSSTDEVQAAFIGSDILDALLGHGVRVLLVTHFQRLALHYRGRPDACFLRAERLSDGTRSHRLVPGAPEPTSHALDIYRQAMGQDDEYPQGDESTEGVAS
ncbi:MAG: hypothetical protein QM582_18765 [Micropruina sp.]|uniref:MutS-related protein n=1 Tax=Micropruina sp. TaxID=2737536 RepID=UPI0039E69491